MSISILLLDCSYPLGDKLRRQGFDVAQGTMGYATRYRQLPSPFYEHDVIIYNPYFFSATDPDDRSPLVKPDTLRNHIWNGAVCLVFVNYLCDSIANHNIAYGWLPFMPPLEFTMDYKPLSILSYREQFAGPENYALSESVRDYRPLISESDLKIPVRIKLCTRDYGMDRPDVIPLFVNKQVDILGAFLKFGNGKFVVLPQYKDNESLIMTFLNRVLPRVCKGKTSTDIIETFQSAEEHAAASEIQAIETDRARLDENLETAIERWARAQRLKTTRIKDDETAKFIITYVKQAQQQDDVALFYLYKVIEILEKKFGNESAAKATLGCNAEWNFIGKVANASYGNIRHAPRPGEKIKEWSDEDIKKCFEGVEKIIHAYFATLF